MPAERPRRPAAGRRRLAGAILALALVLTASLAVRAATASTSGTDAGGRVLVTGVALGSGSSTMSASALADRLANAEALGVGWVRVGLSWASVQPYSPLVSDWAGFDRVVAAAAAHHLKVLAVVGFTPSWARPRSCAQYTCAPAQPAQFATFAKEAATRYGDQVGAWEVWNEPNLHTFWEPSPNAAQYAHLLSLTATAVHAAVPGATVISGGLAMVPGSARDVSGLDFLTWVCQNGGLASADGVGLHPYSSPVPPSYYATWSGWSQMWQTPVNAESILQGCGQGAKPLWITEYGAPTNGPGPAASPSDYQLSSRPNHVDNALQSQMATQSVSIAAGSPAVAALFWYTDEDSASIPLSNQGFYGLRTFGGSAKPAWSALHSALAQATG
jgi:polysaccharide biosynthesis protein PslG